MRPGAADDSSLAAQDRVTSLRERLWIVPEIRVPVRVPRVVLRHLANDQVGFPQPLQGNVTPLFIGHSRALTPRGCNSLGPSPLCTKATRSMTRAPTLRTRYEQLFGRVAERRERFACRIRQELRHFLEGHSPPNQCFPGEPPATPAGLVVLDHSQFGIEFAVVCPKAPGFQVVQARDVVSSFADEQRQ